MLKGDLRKQAILDTAEALFFEKGYAKTTVQDFLDALDCSKGSFYHHFESKLQVLTALCRQKAMNGFAQYQAGGYESPLARLNGLFYWAMPFREGEERTVALLLPLAEATDGHMVLDAMLDGQREEFLPELRNVLDLLKAQGLAHWRHPMLPDLLWDAYCALYRRLMTEAAHIRQGGGTGTAVQCVEAARFLWERTLDLPFGSVELIRADEALRTVSHASFRLKAMEGQGDKSEINQK